MGKLFSIFITALMFLNSGCKNVYLKPTSTCIPLSSFDTLVISPFNIDSAFVEETQYKGIPHEIAIATVEQFKDYIEEYKMFRKTIISSDCADQAIKIDWKINSLIHNGGSFHVFFSGKIINCQTGETLYKFDREDINSISFRLSHQIADDLSTYMKAIMKCSK